MIKEYLVKKFLEHESRMLAEHIQISDDLKRKHDAVERAKMYGDDDDYIEALNDYINAVERFREYDRRF